MLNTLPRLSDESLFGVFSCLSGVSEGTRVYLAQPCFPTDLAVTNVGTGVGRIHGIRMNQHPRNEGDGLLHVAV